MSIEAPANNESEIEIDKEREIEAAMELISGDEFLKDDDRARNTVEKGGRTPDGRIIDIGDFLAARRAYLELGQAEKKVAAARNKNREAFDFASITVVHSERSDIEQK